MDDLNLEDDPFEVVRKQLEHHSKIIDMQATRLDNQEAMLGSLTMAYVEMFAAVDMLVKTVVEGFPSVEEQEKFLKTFDEFRSSVMKSVQEASRSGIEGIDSDTQGAMDNVATGSNANIN